MLSGNADTEITSRSVLNTNISSLGIRKAAAAALIGLQALATLRLEARVTFGVAGARDAWNPFKRPAGAFPSLVIANRALFS